jgi:nucleotide-binding universal stress UspA family protein
VSVLPRWGESPPAHEFLPITGELLKERLASVILQGQRALGNGTPSWTIRLIDSSSIVDSIAETARTEGHDLIVTGNRRGWITRWLRRPTALAVAQRSGVAVLVVPQSASTLPARAIVGVGGTDADPAIATSTVGVLAENAPVHLVHVDTAGATACLTAYAKRTDADLIALGDSHPATIADRVSGGTRRRILRAFDGFVLLRGTETAAHGRAPESEGRPGP